jgi:uncharacterized surface protein with fasciclin (FAS1) repeats
VLNPDLRGIIKQWNFHQLNKPMKKFKEQFNKFAKVILSVLMAATLLFVSSCEDDSKADELDKILYEVDNTDYFSAFKAAIDAAGVRATLSGQGPFTVFAPTNDAFAELDEGVLADLLANPDELEKVVLYHVVAGVVMSSDLSNGELTTLNNGEKVTVALSNGVMINDANVTGPDVEASNGVIHILDEVLIPDNLN